MKPPVAALAIGVCAASGFAQIRYDLESTLFVAQCAAWINDRPEPLYHDDFDTDFERAEVQTEIAGMIFRPRVESWAESTGGSHGIFRSDLGVNIEDGSTLSAPARWASGSWSHRAEFDVEVRSRVQISVDIGTFRSLEFTELEPCRLTGPDGVVVSGTPTTGRTSWTWFLDLRRGRYTYEASAAFHAEVDGVEGLDDRASHFVRIVDYGHVCRADIDEDDELTVFDFLLFQNLFDAGDMLADFDDDEELTLFDFLAFQSLFVAGCP
jgi:hypothetical protein